MIKMSNHAVLSRDTVPLASFQSALSVSMLFPYVLPTQLLGPGCYELLVFALCEHIVAHKGLHHQVVGVGLALEHGE